MLMLGIACCAGLLYLMHLGDRRIDWAGLANQRFAERDWAASYEAAGRALATSPDDHALLFLRSRAGEQLRLFKQAMADLDTAIQLAPREVQYRLSKVSLLMRQGQGEEAIAFVDGMLAESPGLPPLLLTSAATRLSQLRLIEERTLDLLNAVHPEILSNRQRLNEHYRSPRPDSVARHLLTEPLPLGPTRSAIDEGLQRCFALLREVDQVLSDEALYVNRQSGTLTRIEADLRLGRLLRAKEELETLLHGDLNMAGRRATLMLNARLLEEIGPATSLARCAADLCALDTPPGGAPPLTLLADQFEAEYFVADADPARREAWLRTVDAHLREHERSDLRTLGYRGLAALRWSASPASLSDIAIPNLGKVYTALQVQQRTDRSIKEPRRAQRFMVGLLDAYRQAGRLGEGMQVANTLVAVAPNDPAILTQRADTLSGLERYKEAANDLLHAMRTSAGDEALFHHWLDTANRDLDGLGRSPRDLAVLAADRFTRALKHSENQGDVIINEFARHDRLLTNNPIMAWLMSEEYGRLGQSDLSQAFLARAVRSEPTVPWFRLRLGQRLLDLGRYEAAANEFRHILEHHPEDFRAAWYAYQSETYAGRVSKARELRTRSIETDPQNSGLKFGIAAALDAGDTERARGMLAPHLEDQDPFIQLLAGRTRMAEGNFTAALATLQRAQALDPSSSEIQQEVVFCHAILGDRAAFEAELATFAGLPRLVPPPAIDSLAGALEQHGLRGEAAEVRLAVARRFAEPIALDLRGRAAVTLLRAGDSRPLEQLRGEPDLTGALPAEAVRAAFGLLLRDHGVAPAADYLRGIGDQPQREWAELALAAALAQTALHTDAQRHLDRYLETLGGRPVPLDDAAVYSILKARLGSNASGVLIAPGAEIELAWLDKLGATRKSVEDLYLMMYLFEFAGQTFDPQALAAAQLLAAQGFDTSSASRVQARVLARSESATAATSALIARYRHQVRDFATYRDLAELLLKSDASGRLLTALGAAGVPLFPGRIEPLLYLARGNLRQGHFADALRVLDKTPDQHGDPAVLVSVLVELARATAANPPLQRALASRIAALHPAADGREFLVTRLRDREGMRAEAIELLAPLVRQDPTFYAGAAVLVEALLGERRSAELAPIAERLAAVIPNHPAAATAGDDFERIARALARSGDPAAAAEFIDVALEAVPTHLGLRMLRGDIHRELGRDGLAIQDLSLLCLLAPLDSDMQFNYGEALLAERTDLAAIVADLMPGLMARAADDPRLHALRARLLFLKDETRAAASEMKLAADGAPENRTFRYLAGLYAFLADEFAAARAAFAMLPKGHPLAERIQWIDQAAAKATTQPTVKDAP